MAATVLMQAHRHASADFHDSREPDVHIGVLTFHAALNPGAFLQAYSTVAALRRLGHDPVIIDYMPRRLRPRPYRKFLSLRAIPPRGFRKCMDRLRLYKAFKTAQGRLPLTRRFRRRGDLAGERFDAAVVGADIVWNFRSRHFGKDPVYFGAGLNAGRLIAYAPSCGVCTLDDAIPAYVREGLGRFAAISVRDENTAGIVKAACGRSAAILPDPAVGLEVAGLGEGPGIDKYVLVYAFNPFDDRQVEEIRRYARSRRLRTVGVCYRQGWCDENRIAAGPFQWLGLIENASCVVTTMFHGAVFAIKYAKPFAVSMHRTIRNKAQPLLRELDLTWRVMSDRQGLDEMFAREIDYAPVHRKLQQMAEAGVKWLEEALNA